MLSVGNTACGKLAKIIPKPFQGLKLQSVEVQMVYLLRKITPKPFQGLKPFDYARESPYSTTQNHPQTLPGIETLP
ncbi:MAG TPA: hypothetical protein IGS37_18635 [Synechococcales cyanobacterium M55_K2018_004]|nr:hypothetical protein [Synechococcales cyanobacterium M55_K2018_004]